MRVTLTITEIHRWLELNEHEGVVIGLIGSREVSCHVLLPDANGWGRHAPGRSLEIELRLERSGTVEPADPSEPLSLRRVDGAIHRAVGEVREIAGELLLLDVGMPLSVDLDITPAMAHAIPRIAVGDRIAIVGMLEADLDPE